LTDFAVRLEAFAGDVPVVLSVRAVDKTYDATVEGLRSLWRDFGECMAELVPATWVPFSVTVTVSADG
jgi:hypothetical protein